MYKYAQTCFLYSGKSSNGKGIVPCVPGCDTHYYIFFGCFYLVTPLLLKDVVSVTNYMTVQKWLYLHLTAHICVFGDFNAHRAKWLHHSNVTDIVDFYFVYYSISLSNYWHLYLFLWRFSRFSGQQASLLDFLLISSPDSWSLQLLQFRIALYCLLIFPLPRLLDTNSHNIYFCCQRADSNSVSRFSLQCILEENVWCSYR